MAAVRERIDAGRGAGGAPCGGATGADGVDGGGANPLGARHRSERARVAMQAAVGEPKPVGTQEGTIVSVSGWDYTTRACAVNDSGAVYCGDYGSMTEWVASATTQVSGLANGQCAIVNGSVQCSSVSVPETVNTDDGSVTLLGCYSDGCCAATDAPALYCWGDTVEKFGVDSAEPHEVTLPFGKQVLQVGAGQVHVCALLEGGQVQCFGQD